jgi:N-acetylmuramoyl-L-alanine amidase
VWLIYCAIGLPTAQPASLKPTRVAGRDCVTVTTLATHYGLGRDLRAGTTRAEYRTPSTHLSVRADERRLILNGVTHWLTTPILSARGQLWIALVDVQKTIDPILHPDRRRAASTTIVLDPGHGGADRGTRGHHTREKDLTLDLTQRVQRHLAAANRRVLLTRTRDETLALETRTEYTRRQRANLFVSLHFNAGGSATGIETYCLPPAGAAPTSRPPSRSGGDAVAGNRHDDANVLLAHCVQAALLRATGAQDRGVRRARFQVLRDASCPAILVEAGFLSNAAEERRIRAVEYRERLAKAIADGILAYGRTVDGK